MADHLIPLPTSFRYLNQFAPSTWAPKPSLFRCVTTAAATLAEIAYPGRWIPEELEHDLYVKLAGPDVVSDQKGIDKQPLLDWFKSVGIGYIDMADLLGDHAALKAEMQAQNEQGIPQLITVADESFLRDALTDAKLHNWTDTGLSHAFVRVGFSDNQGYGLYYEPAAPGFAQPVPISWDASIMLAGVITVVAVMPHGVPIPPSGFSFQHGTWPTPKPTLDVAKVEVTLAAALTALSAAQAGLTNLASDLAALKQEV